MRADHSSITGALENFLILVYSMYFRFIPASELTECETSHARVLLRKSSYIHPHCTNATAGRAMHEPLPINRFAPALVPPMPAHPQHQSAARYLLGGRYRHIANFLSPFVLVYWER